MYWCYLCCSYICWCWLRRVFSENSTGRESIRCFISLLRESRGGADTTLVLVSVISSFFSSREYIDSRRQVLDTAFSYKSDGRMVLFKSIKQESISFLSEDLKKDWMLHKVKTGKKMDMVQMKCWAYPVSIWKWCRGKRESPTPVFFKV